MTSPHKNSLTDLCDKVSVDCEATLIIGCGRGSASRGRTDRGAGELVGCQWVMHSGNDDDGTGSEADKLLGDTAEQQAGQLAATAPAYYDHLDRAARGDIDQ